MAMRKELRTPSILGRGETFTPDKHTQLLVAKDYTFINNYTLRQQYKLAQAYAKVRNLEFRADRKIRLQTFQEYLALVQPTRGRPDFDKQTRPMFPADEEYRNKFTALHYPEGKMVVLVDKAVHANLKNSLDQYVLDVGREGYWATVWTVSGAAPKDIRDFLQKEHPVGALLVGALAAPWYEIDGDQFPCDLYYMDLNGKWTDPDGNGKFNAHSGEVNPEVWIGRLYTPTAGGNDVALLKDYFWRNHQFRLGLLGHARSALAYVDDDWTGFDDCAFDEMFPPTLITKYTNPGVTDADLFKAEVQSLRSWVQICAHSWDQGHALRVGDVNEFIYSEDFRDKNPPNAHFYNLFACGPGRYTSDNYLGGWYVFDKAGGGRNHGLAAIASAKSGSMLFFEDFYRPLGKGKIIGDAFVDWWKARGPTHDSGEIYWFYGMVLLGDPTLNWWKGATPALEQPQKEDVFDHFPRKMQLRWDPVNIPNAMYSVEIDAFGAVHAGQWAEATLDTFLMVHNLTDHTMDHEFVGKQRGRWRVRAQVDGTKCRWSPWSYFQFNI